MTQHNIDPSAPLLPTAGRRDVLRAGIGVLALLPLAGCGIFDDDPKTVLPGRREDVLSVGAGLTVDESDTTPVSLPPPTLDGEWAQGGRIPSHEAINEQLGGLKPLWTQSFGKGQTGRGALTAEPVVSNNRVFTMDTDGVVSAFDLASGARLWRTPTKPKKARSTNVGGGLGLADGTLYVVNGLAESLALDPQTGAIRWRVDVGTPGRSAPTIVDGRVFFGTIDEKLFALDAATGKTIWTFQATAGDTVVLGQPAPAVVGNSVLAGFGSGDVVALRADSGEMLWSDTLGSTGGRNSVMDFPSVHGLPAIVGGTAYVISVGQVLTAIDLRSGRRLWERQVGGKDGLVVCGDWLFVLSAEQQLACIDRSNGHVRWVTVLPRFRNTKKNKNPILWSGPLLADNKLFCVSDFPKQGMIRVDAVSGKVVDITPLPDAGVMSPIAAAGRLLVVTDDGKLSVFG
ncbi:PQQ-binding-like beta-propeller repeat protein [Rhizosaccharibacter radicis]|uniref:PQQ-like beta-propeller repeat protein n=1 Tax=Rhizosaccharibacter radicis TaxID=2782605 RepID=A0ABT1VZK9_9PROT|nr:PQQ-like beta-propeller repeat protein [Acetobacteraceae bacterium KSS12]